MEAIRMGLVSFVGRHGPGQYTGRSDQLSSLETPTKPTGILSSDGASSLEQNGPVHISGYAVLSGLSGRCRVVESLLSLLTPRRRIVMICARQAIAKSI